MLVELAIETLLADVPLRAVAEKRQGNGDVTTEANAGAPVLVAPARLVSGAESAGELAPDLPGARHLRGVAAVRGGGTSGFFSNGAITGMPVLCAGQLRPAV